MKIHWQKLLLVIAVFGFSASGRTISTSVYTSEPWVMDVSGGIIVGGGEALPGFGLQVAGNLKTDFPLYLGGEVGTFFATGRYSSGVVIPILAKLYTPVAISDRAHFRIGASIGPVIASGSGFTGSGLAFLFDPALIFALGNKTDLSAQARFGVMDGTFVALPELGVTFAI